jgi:hypothetical protein
MLGFVPQRGRFRSYFFIHIKIVQINVNGVNSYQVGNGLVHPLFAAAGTVNCRWY